MFSPTNGAAPAGAPARASRRRPRPTSNESITSQPKAKRQRASIDPQTFIADGGVETRQRKASIASSALVRKESRDSLAPKRELSVRSKKVKGDRYHKGDGSTVLTKNDTYTVSRLPALPDRLQAANAGRQHGLIDSDRGYALTLTKTHALVWPYSINTTTPETFTFTLPHPSKHDTDLLPLGSLVSPPASSAEPGLVVVMPASGKITYWESISSAATLDLIQQQRHGVEYTIPGMYHNETVLQILNAESAGFVLTFSTGRLAYLSVRDNQGRPNIATQYLRSANSQTGSIFGSFKSMLSSSWKGDVAAARAGPSPGPGERTVVTAGTKGKLSLWNLHRGGHNHLEAEGEAKDLIIEEIKRTDSSLIGLDSETFEIHDFTFAPSPTEQAHSDALTYREENGTELLILSSMTNQGVAHYALSQIFIRPGLITAGAVRHITSYSTPVTKNAISRPRLYLPNPGVAAFVVFQRAVVITSMANEPDSPEAQLLADSHIGPQTFEDVVDFRRDTGVEIVGSGLEEPHHPSRAEDPRQKRHATKAPAVVLQVKGDAIIRIALVDPTKFTSSKPPQVTAKSKLEQAVFFGNVNNNILSFSGRSEMQFGSEEVGIAAFALSTEILTSSTPYLPSIPGTIRENMIIRQEALDTLIKHTQKMNVELDRSTKWKLLWAAEKLAAAAAAWNKYDSGLATRPADIKTDLWDFIVIYIKEDMKTMPNAEIGEVDRVRHYFIHDVDKFSLIPAFAYKAVDFRQKSALEKLKPHQMAHMICEANELIIVTLRAAYAFRSEHAEAYGIEDDLDQNNGLLTDNVASVPEPWTCQDHVTSCTKDQAVKCVQFLIEAEKRDDMAHPEQIQQIREDLPRLVDLACLTANEKFLYYSGQRDKKRYEKGFKLEHEMLGTQKKLLNNLADVGLTDEAIDLAQKHSNMTVLAQLLMERIWGAQKTIQGLQGAIGTTDADVDAVQDAIANFEEIIEVTEARREASMAQFGYFFADAMYDHFIKRKHAHDLLIEGVRHPKEVTKYFRDHPAYAKLAWINEIKTEKNFDQAAKDLIEQGTKRETDLWSKKVQLSIGKLVRLAGKNYSQVGGLIVPDAGASDLQEVERQLEIVNIQEKIFAHVFPATNGAIDEDAGKDVALDVFANPQLKKKHALSTVLAEKMDRLLKRSAMNALDLVDLLTLMGPRKIDGGQTPLEGDIAGQEFFFALKALNADGPEEKSQFILAEKNIWRRCLLRDDWKAVNSTAGKGDDEVSEKLRGSALYQTLHLGYKNDLFSKTARTTVITPNQLLGSPSELDVRYAGLDDGLRSPLLSDLHAEDASLKVLVDKLRLQKWFEGCDAIAKKDVEKEKKQEELEIKEVEAMKNKLENVERLIEEKLSNTAREYLQAKQMTQVVGRRAREGTPRGVQGLLKQGSSLSSSPGVSFKSSMRP